MSKTQLYQPNNITYLDYIKTLLRSEFTTQLAMVDTDESGNIKAVMYPVHMGHTARERVVVEELEVSSISILYAIHFHTFREEKRIYFPDNISPRECKERYYDKIGTLVNNTLIKKDPTYLIKKDSEKWKTHPLRNLKISDELKEKLKKPDS
jgi:hypothetical protein